MLKKPNRAARKRRQRERRYRFQYKGPWQNYDHGDYVREQPCVVGFNCIGGIQAAHTTPKGRTPGDKESWTRLVPLCMGHHQEFDVACANDPEHFKKRYRGIDLVKIAQTLTIEAYLANEGED